jgi:hypothetical protein
VAFDLSKVPLTSFKWRREGGFMLADFKIRNLNTFSVENVVVRCTYAIQTFSSYSVEANEQTLAQTIEPAATSDLTNVNMGANRPLLIGAGPRRTVAPAFACAARRPEVTIEIKAGTPLRRRVIAPHNW